MAAIRTTRDLAATVRGSRVEHGWSQTELARRARVSRSWIGDLEAGKPTAEIGRVLAVLDALGIELTAGTTRASSAPLDLDAHVQRYQR